MIGKPLTMKIPEDYSLRKLSISRAALRPEAMAFTTRLAPETASPAANILWRLVNWPFVLILFLPSSSMDSLSAVLRYSDEKSKGK
jgi:hypothetical protein